jgi:hypothetical protein
MIRTVQYTLKDMKIYLKLPVDTVNLLYISVIRNNLNVSNRSITERYYDKPLVKIWVSFRIPTQHIFVELTIFL